MRVIFIKIAFYTEYIPPEKFQKCVMHAYIRVKTDTKNSLLTVNSSAYVDGNAIINGPFYDTKWKNEKIDTRTKYAIGFSGWYEKTSLSAYQYDEEGNLRTKEVFSWNSRKNEMNPARR